MNQLTLPVPQTVAQMRENFDHGFALPAHRKDETSEDLLLIRLGHLPYALRMSEVAGLQRSAGVTPLPGPLATLIGMASHRNRVLPVYDLAALLGQPVSQDPTWQIVTQAPAVILAIDEFERHIRCPRSAIATQTLAEDAREAEATGAPHVQAHLHTDEGQRPIVSLAAVLRTIQHLAQTARQER